MQGPTGSHSATEARCASCARPLAGRGSFRLRSAGGAVWKCVRCGFIDRPLLRRSALVASVVGSALVALNQGDQLLAGSFPWSTSWYKVPLTYLVPFCVATYGALSNGYMGAAERARS